MTRQRDELWVSKLTERLSLLPFEHWTSRIKNVASCQQNSTGPKKEVLCQQNSRVPEYNIQTKIE